jgi:hypothetical protein
MRPLPVLALVAALAACSAERAPADGAASVDPPTAATPPVTETPAPAPEPPAPAPAPAPAPGGEDAQASFAGYGSLAFGTPAADMAKAWGGELKEVGKDANPTCYFMTPTWVTRPADFNFMVSNGKFARFGTESAKYAAPGGGKVGMTEAQLQALYNNALTASPHKYTDGKYLEIAASGVAPTKLVFETDAAGTATEWRVGLTPEVGYVEGCS